MAMLEGGDFHCYIHDFKTSSLDEWNAHCSDTEHTESGTGFCISCGIPIEFDNLPYHPIQEDGSKGIALKCTDCSEKSQGSVTVRKISK